MLNKSIFVLILGAALILGTAAVPGFSSAHAADVCPQGVEKDGFIAYKLCLWDTDKLIWGSSESRGKVRKNLYRSGKLYPGSLSIEVGLRGLKPNMVVELYSTSESGAVVEGVLASTAQGEMNVLVTALNGQATLWVPEKALTGNHFVKLRSNESTAELGYNHPLKAWFTKAGEDVLPSGKLRYGATRLNTSVDH